MRSTCVGSSDDRLSLPLDSIERMTFPLQTERLEITVLTAAHRDGFVAYRQEPEVARFQSWTSSYSTRDADELIAAQPAGGMPQPGGWVQLAVLLSATSDTNRLVGDVAVGVDPVQPDTYELGVTIAPSHQGRGYAMEALRAVIDLLMVHHGAHRIVMQGDARNAAVLRLMHRLALRHEGSVVEGDWFKGEWTTLERFALLRREWESRPW